MPFLYAFPLRLFSSEENAGIEVTKRHPGGAHYKADKPQGRTGVALELRQGARGLERRRFKKMLQEEQLMMEENPGDCSGGYASTGGNTWSGNGTEGGGGAKGAETGVAPLYLDFLNLVPALRNRDLVPLLHQFLEEGQHLQVPQPTMPTGGADKGHPPPSLPAEAAAP